LPRRGGLPGCRPFLFSFSPATGAAASAVGAAPSAGGAAVGAAAFGASAGPALLAGAVVAGSSFFFALFRPRDETHIGAPSPGAPLPAYFFKKTRLLLDRDPHAAGSPLNDTHRVLHVPRVQVGYLLRGDLPHLRLRHLEALVLARPLLLLLAR